MQKARQRDGFIGTAKLSLFCSGLTLIFFCFGPFVVVLSTINRLFSVALLLCYRGLIVVLSINLTLNTLSGLLQVVISAQGALLLSSATTDVSSSGNRLGRVGQSRYCQQR